MPIRTIASKQAYEQLWQSADTVGTVLLTLVLDSYGQANAPQPGMPQSAPTQ